MLPLSNRQQMGVHLGQAGPCLTLAAALDTPPSAAAGSCLQLKTWTMSR